jgi:hypothetical protein
VLATPLPVTPLEGQADLDSLSLPPEPDCPFHHGRSSLCVSRWSGPSAPPDDASIGTNPVPLYENPHAAACCPVVGNRSLLTFGRHRRRTYGPVPYPAGFAQGVLTEPMPTWQWLRPAADLHRFEVVVDLLRQDVDAGRTRTAHHVEPHGTDRGRLARAGCGHPSRVSGVSVSVTEIGSRAWRGLRSRLARRWRGGPRRGPGSAVRRG